MLSYVDRPAVHSTPYTNRPIVGGVLHDTESAGPITTAQSLGGWHWSVGRDGQLYRDVDEDQAAWHVRACDRWRPSWVLDAPDGAVSPANFCTVGIELVSSAADRAAGLPYTDAQYATLRLLVADIESRYGSLPWVGHGELQLDRSDPVAFDWDRAGFGPRTDEGRRAVQPVPVPAPVSITDDQQHLLALCTQLGWGAQSVIDAVQRIGALEQQLAEVQAASTQAQGQAQDWHDRLAMIGTILQGAAL